MGIYGYLQRAAKPFHIYAYILIYIYIHFRLLVQKTLKRSACDLLNLAYALCAMKCHESMVLVRIEFDEGKA